MSSSAYLQAAEFGMDLLGAFGQIESQRYQRTALRIQGDMERRQIRRQAEEEALDRTLQLRGLIGQQNAAMGNMGVVGGRTARLFRNQAQLARRRAQDAADFRTTSALGASEFRQRTGVSATRIAQAQVFTDLLGAGIGHGQQMTQRRERQQVS